jgi:uncharacterized protein YkwD
MLAKINSVRTHKLTENRLLDTIAQKRADTIPYELDHHAGFHKLIKDGTFNNVIIAYVGEILASNHCPSTEQIFTQWRNSPEHWSAITNEQYDVLGIGFNGQSVVVIFGDLR